MGVFPRKWVGVSWESDRLQRLENLGNHAVGVRQNVVIPEADNPKPTIPQVLGPLEVFWPGVGMLATVDPNDQIPFTAD